MTVPLTVNGESVKVSETAFVAPSHKGIVPPVPAPDITDELSILCHKSVPAPGVTSENIHQSPTAQSLVLHLIRLELRYLLYLLYNNYLIL